MKIPIDCFGEYLHVGTIVCLAENGIQKPGVCCVFATNGDARIAFYHEDPGGKIRTKLQTIPHALVMSSCVTVPATGLNEAVGLYRRIKEHSALLIAESMSSPPAKRR